MSGKDESRVPTHKPSTKTLVPLGAREKHDLESMRAYLASGPDLSAAMSIQRPASKKMPIDKNSTIPEKSKQIELHSLDSKNQKELLRKNRNRWSRRSTGWLLLRCCVLELPMGILFAVLLSFYCLRELHEDYFLPFLKAAARTDADLETEFTYYDRICGVQDISTHNLTDLVLTEDQTTEVAVDMLLAHGALVVPKLLSQDTVLKLRSYVQHRNRALTPEQALPVSQGKLRKSFTIDATEDPILPVALKEIATHPKLQPLIERLLGKDAGITEITAITSFYGAEGQAWHPDVKPDGSPMKFARTYAHSYSVFIPLQDTTKAMGATEYLPGTHFCGDDNTMYSLCKSFGIPMSEASPDHVWHSGDAAVVSQQAWHRGGEHSNPDSPERILFVVSFISRPDLTHDRRQLSRGTYFHMRWNMWGHTLRDMLDAERSMAKPFSILRCLHLWKPSDRKYGFDFLTSSALRMANYQNGAKVKHLRGFAETVVSKVLPTWLQGTIGRGKEAWPQYFGETFGKCFDFFFTVNCVVVAAYASAVLLAAWVRRDSGIASRATLRILFMYGMLSFFCHRILHDMRHTEFAKDMSFGRLLKRLPSGANNDLAKDQFISSGPTTAPDRLDVLLGTRYDARFLGVFDRFLDYHPGNVEYRRLIRKQAGHYRSYLRGFYLGGLPKVFSEQVIDSVVAPVTRLSRFVQQDYRSGVWRVMSLSEAQEHTRVALLAEATVVLGQVEREISYLVADHRLGLRRETRLAREALSYLFHLKRHALFPERQVASIAQMSSILPKQSAGMRILSRLHGQIALKSRSSINRSSHHNRWTNPLGRTGSFEVGDTVLLQGKKKRKHVTIEQVHNDGTYTVLHNDGTLKGNVNASRIHRLVHVEEGTRVLANFEGAGKWFPGVVVWVRPSLEVDIQYDDGDFEEYVPHWLYEVEL